MNVTTLNLCRFNWFMHFKPEIGAVRQSPATQFCASFRCDNSILTQPLSVIVSLRLMFCQTYKWAIRDVVPTVWR